MQEARVRYALLIICLACLGGSGYLLLSDGQASPQPVPRPIVITPPPPDTVQKTKKRRAISSPVPGTIPNAPTRIYVDVAGAVRRPSLYVLPPDSRVMQAVLAAGGPTEDADIEAVNLAQKVADGEKIFVPKRLPPSLSMPQDVPTPAGDRTAISPDPASGMGAKSTHSSHSNKINAGSAEQVGLNSATAEQLQRLPGVGPSMASRILAYRQQAGGFSKIEDLMMVTGIGPKKFAKIAPFVTLN